MGLEDLHADRPSADDAALNKVNDDGVAKYQVNATPTIVVDGPPEAGFENLNARLDAALAKK